MKNNLFELYYILHLPLSPCPKFYYLDLEVDAFKGYFGD